MGSQTRDLRTPSGASVALHPLAAFLCDCRAAGVEGGQETRLPLPPLPHSAGSAVPADPLALPGPYHSSKEMPGVLYPPVSVWSRCGDVYYCARCTHEAWRSQESWLKSQSWEVAELGFESRQSDSGPDQQSATILYSLQSATPRGWKVWFCFWLRS